MKDEINNMAFKSEAARRRFEKAANALSAFGKVEILSPSANYKNEYSARVKMPFAGPRDSDLSAGEMVVSIFVRERMKNLASVSVGHFPNEASYRAVQRRLRERGEPGFVRNEREWVSQHDVPVEELSPAILRCLAELASRRANWMPGLIDL